MLNFLEHLLKLQLNGIVFFSYKIMSFLLIRVQMYHVSYTVSRNLISKIMSATICLKKKTNCPLVGYDAGAQ